MGLKKQYKRISFANIIERKHVDEYFRSLRQQGEESRIAGHFLEYLQDEGFPFEYDDFDEVYKTSLDHKSKYDKLSY